MSAQDNISPQQFFHGSASRFKEGQVLTNAFSTTNISGADYYAAKKSAETGRMFGHVYEVRPSDDVQKDISDPGVDDQYQSSRLTVVRHKYRVEKGRFL